MTILRCPWPRCDFTAAPDDRNASTDLGQHLLDYPFSDKHRNPAAGDHASPEQPAPHPMVIGPDTMPTQSDLHIGLVVFRYTESLKRGWVKAEMPCCPRDRLTERLGRAVHLPTAYDQQVENAVCPPCGWRWEVSLDDKGGEDYTAVFRLAETVAVAQSTRHYRSL